MFQQVSVVWSLGDFMVSAVRYTGQCVGQGEAATVSVVPG